MTRSMIFCCLALMLAACSKKNDGDQEYISASVNGQSWYSSNIDVTLTGTSTRGKGTYNGSTITILVRDTAKGSYAFPQVAEATGQLVSFAARMFESDYLVEWTTREESGGSMFILEAATAESMFTQFSPVDTVLSKGAGDQSYQTTAVIPLALENGVHLRLKEEGLNNGVTYSKVIALGSVGATSYSEPGGTARRGFSGAITVVNAEGDYVAGTFQFNVKTTAGELLRIENGRFRLRYR